MDIKKNFQTFDPPEDTETLESLHEIAENIKISKPSIPQRILKH